MSWIIVCLESLVLYNKIQDLESLHLFLSRSVCVAIRRFTTRTTPSCSSRSSKPNTSLTRRTGTTSLIQVAPFPSSHHSSALHQACIISAQTFLCPSEHLPKCLFIRIRSITLERSSLLLHQVLREQLIKFWLMPKPGQRFSSSWACSVLPDDLLEKCQTLTSWTELELFFSLLQLRTSSDIWWKETRKCATHVNKHCSIRGMKYVLNLIGFIFSPAIKT